MRTAVAEDPYNAGSAAGLPEHDEKNKEISVCCELLWSFCLVLFVKDLVGYLLVRGRGRVVRQHRGLTHLNKNEMKVCTQAYCNHWHHPDNKGE